MKLLLQVFLAVALASVANAEVVGEITLVFGDVAAICLVSEDRASGALGTFSKLLTRVSESSFCCCSNICTESISVLSFGRSTSLVQFDAR